MAYSFRSVVLDEVMSKAQILDLPLRSAKADSLRWTLACDCWSARAETL
jgi:hypothetical protein